MISFLIFWLTLMALKTNDVAKDMEKFTEEETKKQLKQQTEEALKEEGESITLLKNPKLLDIIVKEIQDKRGLLVKKKQSNVFLLLPIAD